MLDAQYRLFAHTAGLARPYYEEDSLPHEVTARVSVAPDPTLPLGSVARDGMPKERRVPHPYARIPYF